MELLVQHIKNWGLEGLGLFYSVYRAQVCDNQDPENRGRVKVIVPGIVEIPREGIWAEPIFPYAGNQHGTYMVPEVNDWVYVLFECGKIYSPLYLGGWYAKDELPSDFTNERVRGIKTANGHVLILNDDRNTIEIYTNNGLKFILNDEAGQIKISCKNKREIVMTENEIKIGSEQASQPLVLGFKLVSWLAKLYAWATAVGGIIGVSPSSFDCNVPLPTDLLSKDFKQKTE